MGFYKTDGQKATNRHIAWMIWGAAAFLCFFELFIRVMPGTMLQKMQSYHGASSAMFEIASGI
jgi:hypothetical protein